MNQSSKPDSPCIKVCVLQPATQMCVGCYRTIQEIANWSAYSDQQRTLVYTQLAARRAAHRSQPLESEFAPTQRDQPNARCEQCGAEFVCGFLNPETPCWCTKLPHIQPPNRNSANCLCPACLGAIANS